MQKTGVSIDTACSRHSARSARRTLLRNVSHVSASEMIITGQNNVESQHITATTNPVMTEYRAQIPFHILAKPIGPACNLACRYCYYPQGETPVEK